jgi:CheY-like chemotaxis protein
MIRKTLVVDDEVELTEMIKVLLESTGKYEIRTENEGKMATDAAREILVEKLPVIAPKYLSHIGYKLTTVYLIGERLFSTKGN